MVEGVFYDGVGNYLGTDTESPRYRNKNYLTEDADNMLKIMERTANSESNGWQYIYWIAVAVYHLILQVQVTKFGLKRRIEELEQRG